MTYYDLSMWLIVGLVSFVSVFTVISGMDTFFQGPCNEFSTSMNIAVITKAMGKSNIQSSVRTKSLVLEYACREKSNQL